MNRSTPTRSIDPLVARWALAGVAFAVAAFMMVFYVQLLNDSVARGAQSRYSRLNPAPSVPSAVVEAATNASVHLVSTTR